MKNYKVKNKFRFISFIIVLIIGFSALVFVNVSAEDGTESKTIRVSSGDSLWSIAEENYDYKRHDIREYIFILRQINSLDEACIYPGQELILPYWK